MGYQDISSLHYIENLFQNFWSNINVCAIQRLIKVVTPQDIRDIQLKCKNKEDIITLLLFCNTHFILDSEVNLIF